MGARKSKKWYLSKTLWTNFVMGVLVVAMPKTKDFLTEDMLAGIFMAVNMGLRMITDSKLQIK